MPAPVQVRRDHEQLGLGRPRHKRLDAVEHKPVDRPPGGGLQRERVEQRSGFEHRQGGRGYVVADEGRQVGGLLRLVAPQDQGGAHRGRREAGECQAHVAVGQRLGHENVRDRRASLPTPPRSSGTPMTVMPSSAAALSSSPAGAAQSASAADAAGRSCSAANSAPISRSCAARRSGSGRTGPARCAAEPLRPVLPVQRRERAARRRERREAGPLAWNTERSRGVRSRSR